MANTSGGNFIQLIVTTDSESNQGITSADSIQRTVDEAMEGSSDGDVVSSAISGSVAGVATTKVTNFFDKKAEKRWGEAARIGVNTLLSDEQTREAAQREIHNKLNATQRLIAAKNVFSNKDVLLALGGIGAGAILTAKNHAQQIYTKYANYATRSGMSNIANIYQNTISTGLDIAGDVTQIGAGIGLSVKAGVSVAKVAGSSALGGAVGAVLAVASTALTIANKAMEYTQKKSDLMWELQTQMAESIQRINRLGQITAGRGRTSFTKYQM